MTALAYLIAYSIVCMPVVYMIADMIRLGYTKGTFGRYYWATIEHTLRVPAGVCLVLSDIAYWCFPDDDVQVVTSIGRALLTLVIAFRIYMATRDDDDDWWKGKGKKLSTFVRNLRLRSTPKVVPTYG